MKTLTRPIEVKVGCIQAAMDVLGNKWTALILRDLADCSQRFCGLEKSVTGINPRILSQRLDQLEASGIIEKSADGRPSYALTKKGHDLIPVLEAMADWGETYCESNK